MGMGRVPALRLVEDLGHDGGGVVDHAGGQPLGGGFASLGLRSIGLRGLGLGAFWNPRPRLSSP